MLYSLGRRSYATSGICGAFGGSSTSGVEAVRRGTIAERGSTSDWLCAEFCHALARQAPSGWREGAQGRDFPRTAPKALCCKLSTALERSLEGGDGQWVLDPFADDGAKRRGEPQAESRRIPSRPRGSPEPSS